VLLKKQPQHDQMAPKALTSSSPICREEALKPKPHPATRKIARGLESAAFFGNI
jgi:hypothetical protein